MVCLLAFGKKKKKKKEKKRKRKKREKSGKKRKILLETFTKDITDTEEEDFLLAEII